MFGVILAIFVNTKHYHQIVETMFDIADQPHVPVCSYPGVGHSRGLAVVWQRASVCDRRLHLAAYQGDTRHRVSAARQSRPDPACIRRVSEAGQRQERVLQVCLRRHSVSRY